MKMLGERQDKIFRCEEDIDWKIDFQKAGMVANMANAISAAMYDIFEKYSSENESIIKIDGLSLANKIDDLLVKISEITQTPKYNLIANLLKEDFASSEDLSKLFHSFFEKLNKIINLIKNKNKIMKQNYLFGLILSLEKKNINIDPQNLETLIESKIRDLLLEIIYSLYVDNSDFDDREIRLEINNIKEIMDGHVYGVKLGSYIKAARDALNPSIGERTISHLENLKFEEVASGELSKHFDPQIGIIVSQISGNMTLKGIEESYRGMCNKGEYCDVGTCRYRTFGCELFSRVKAVFSIDGASISTTGNPLKGQQINVIPITTQAGVEVDNVIIDHHGPLSLDANSESTTLQSHNIIISVIEAAQKFYANRTIDNKSPLKKLFESLGIPANHECEYVNYKVGFKYIFDLIEVKINMPDPDTCFPLAENMFVRAIISAMDSEVFSNDYKLYSNQLWLKVEQIIKSSSDFLNCDLVTYLIESLNIRSKYISPDFIIDLFKKRVQLDELKQDNPFDPLEIYLASIKNKDPQANIENLRLEIEIIIKQVFRIFYNEDYAVKQSINPRYLERLKLAFLESCSNLNETDNKLSSFFKISLNLLNKLDIVARSISIIDANSGTTDPSKLDKINHGFNFPDKSRQKAESWHLMLDSLHNSQKKVMGGYYKFDRKCLQAYLIPSSWQLLALGFAMVDSEAKLNFDNYNKFLQETTGSELRSLTGKPSYQKFYRYTNESGGTKENESFIAYYNPREQPTDGSVDAGNIRTLISLESDPAITISSTSRIDGMVGFYDYTVFTTKESEIVNVKKFTEFASKVAGFITGHEGEKLQNFFGPGGGVRGSRNVGLPFGPEVMIELIVWFHKMKFGTPSKETEDEFNFWLLNLRDQVASSILRSHRNNYAHTSNLQPHLQPA